MRVRYARGEAMRMSIWKVLQLFACAVAFLSTVYAVDRSVPRSFREYPGVEYNVGDIRLTPDWQEKTEWAFARLMYPPGWNDCCRGRFDGDWRQGLSLWTQDFPRAD